MGYWPAHDDPEGEALLEWVDSVKWRIARNSKGYYQIKCPCGLHITWIHKTPHRNHFKQKKRHVQRQPCMRDEAKGGTR